MERFVQRHSAGEGERTKGCRRVKQMAPLVRLDSTGNSASPVNSKPGHDNDFKTEVNHCKMKNLKNYLNFGGLWESALSFGGGCISSRQNLTSPRVPVSTTGDIIEDSNCDHIDKNTVKMCDHSLDKKENFCNTASRFWEGLGFGCRRNSFSNCYEKRSAMNYQRNMDLFKNFHKKTCRQQSPMVNGVSDSLSQMDKNTLNKFPGHCSSPRSQRCWKGRTPPVNGYWNRGDCVVSGQNSRSKTPVQNSHSDANIPSRNGKMSSMVKCAKEEKEAPRKSRLSENTLETTNSDMGLQVNDCDRGQLDWFTYGDNGYAVVENNDGTERAIDKHCDLQPIEIDVCYNIEPSIDRTCIVELEDSESTLNHDEPVVPSCDIGSTQTFAATVVTPSEMPNCAATGDNFSSSKSFLCSNNEKQNDTKDYSYILSLRTNNKKKPSAKKRRRRKAREQDIVCSLKSNSPGSTRSEAELEFGDCGASKLAFILGVDEGHTFYVSLSDGDDPNFSDDEFDGCENDWNNYDDSLCLFNFNFIGSQSAQDQNVPGRPPPSDKITKYNADWGIGDSIDTTQRKIKVHFPSDKSIAKVRPMIAWGYAYRAARKGPWEQFARDRERFSRRILEIQEVILPILEAAHRNCVFSKHHTAHSEPSPI